MLKNLKKNYPNSENQHAPQYLVKCKQDMTYFFEKSSPFASLPVSAWRGGWFGLRGWLRVGGLCGIS